jgi:hypothetical protein
VIGWRRSLPLAPLLLAACGPGTPQVVDGVTLLRYGDLGSGPAQVTVGTVQIADGCIYLDMAMGDRWLLLWPPRSHLEAGGDGVHIVLDARSIRDGDGVSLAGGETSRAEAMAGTRVRACPTDRVWYVTGLVP